MRADCSEPSKWQCAWCVAANMATASINRYS